FRERRRTSCDRTAPGPCSRRWLPSFERADVPRSTPLPSPPRPDRKLLKRLEGLRWIERPYRALSYTFAVRTTSRALDARIRRVLGTFVLPREAALEWSSQTRAHIPR